MNIVRDVKLYFSMRKAAKHLDNAIKQFEGIDLTPEEAALYHILLNMRIRLTQGFELQLFI